ncbi:MAG: hypothetical protein JW804_02025 [Sedimentisphaerales bacterium]|nr:hypothetical protein [Sedimentisphaerales bacterium]
MESRIIEITSAAHKYGNLNLRSCGKGFFPADAFGASSVTKGTGKPITLQVEGLKDVIKTDIPTDNKTNKPRWIFRNRSWVKQFIEIHEIAPGQKITINRVQKRTYEIIPHNGNGEINPKQIEPDKTKQKTYVNESAKSQKISTKILDINYERTCGCKPNHINCLPAKEWLKCQLGVWQFNYESRDIRDKNIHPATFPISLPRKLIELFSHQGELILDPFAGSGTTLIAAQDCGRNAVGFDLLSKYVKLMGRRLKDNANLFSDAKQIAVCEDAINIHKYLPQESVKLIFTSPPYANLLNRKRKNKSRRNRNNEQLGKIEQYSQDPRDLGTMSLENYTTAMGDILESLLPLLKPKGHCVINVPDMWWENKRITIHVSLIQELRKHGYELRNIIIWDRTNIVNQIGIFGWPSNYITMGVTFEYLLDFWRPPEQ